MQFRLWRAAAIVSSPIHLLLAILASDLPMRTNKFWFCSLRRDRRLTKTESTLAVINILDGRDSLIKLDTPPVTPYVYAVIANRSHSVGQLTYKGVALSSNFCRLHHYMEMKRYDAVVQLVEYRTRNQDVAGSTHTRSTASNLEQVANLLSAQANLVSYPQRNGKWVYSIAMATGWRPSVADWGNGVSASCIVGPIVR